jgi:hypothetical protein
MTTSIQAEVAEFAKRLQTSYPTARIEVKDFPSGAAWLDIFREHDWHQLHYYPSWKLFCVDECEEDDAFQLNYRYTYPDFPSAAEQLLRMLSAAQAGMKDGTPEAVEIQENVI